MDCEICHGSRWKSVTVDGVERLTRCDCWRETVVEKLLQDARVPARYARCELATFEHDMNTQREAFRRATRFVEAFPAVDKGLVLYGPHGVGKTHLAVGILKEVIRTKGGRGYFFETRELLKLVRDTYNRATEETEMEVLAPVLDADLLVLDDLGAEKTSEWVQETLGLVVNTRYNARRATIFTSNLVDSPDNTDPQGFIYQLGARTRSRLMEMCDWVEIQGADVREVGPHASAEKIADWQKKSPASPQNVKKSSSLPPKTKGQARARLRDSGVQYELNWSGGKAGSK
jgi:DNA replication protein DnaC